MFDRQLIGDVVLAAVIAIPTVALARPQAVPHREPTTIAAPSQQSTIALASAADRQIGLFR